MKNKNHLFILSILVLIILSATIYSNEVIKSNYSKNFLDKATKTVQAESLTDYYCLRDEQIIFTEDQSNTGLCWDFTGNKMMETMIAKKYNMYIDLSESWISLCAKVFNVDSNETNVCYIGGGGSIDKYYKIVNTYGIMYEEDFEQDYIYNLDSINYVEYYNILKSKAINRFNNSIEKVTLKSSNQSLDALTEQDIINIKNHIKEYSGVSFEFDSSQIDTSTNIKFLNPKAELKRNWHSVVLIGWDNNIVLSNGKDSYVGGFIALNSWGEEWGSDGIFYIPYSVHNIGECYGFKIKDNAINSFYLSKSENMSVSYYKVLNANKYSSNRKEQEVEINQYNVFSMKDLKTTIDLKYTIELQKDFDIQDIKITRKGKDLTSEYRITFNKNILSIKSINEINDWGTYKIELIGDSIEILTFYVISGAEISNCRTYYSDNFILGEKTQRYGLINNLGSNNTSIVEEFIKNKSNTFCTILFFPTTYSRIISIDGVVSETENANNEKIFIYAENKTYAEGYFYITLGNLSIGKNSYKFIISTIDGNSLEYTITLYRYMIVESSEDNEEEENFQKQESLIYRQSRVSIVYDNNDYENFNEKATSYNYLSDGNDLELIEPKKSGYTFCGWFTDSDYKNNIQKITMNEVKIYDGINYIFYVDDIISTQSKTIFLYAKFEIIDISCDYDLLAYKKTSESNTYIQINDGNINLGDYLKIEIKNVNYVVKVGNINKKDVEYKIFINNEESQDYILTFEEMVKSGNIQQENEITISIVFYYNGYKITSCTSDFDNSYKYKINDMNIFYKSENELSVPTIEKEDYNIEYEWFIGNLNSFNSLSVNSKDLEIVSEYYGRVLYCEIKVLRKQDNKVLYSGRTIKKFLFNNVYKIEIEVEDNEYYVPIVGQKLRVSQEVQTLENIETEYIWKIKQSSGQDKIIKITKENTIIVPDICYLNKIYCQIKTTYNNEINLQSTNSLMVISLNYSTKAKYGSVIDIIGISEEYSYEYIWSNGKTAKLILVDKADTEQGQISCSINIKFNENCQMQINLPNIDIEKRKINIHIDNKESYYGEDIKPLTYTFINGNSILVEDLENFSIVLKKEEGTDIGTYRIYLESFDVLDDSMSTYYNLEYEIKNDNGESSVYTIKRLEFDFSKTYIVNEKNNEKYNEDSFVYNGESYSVALSNLPKGIKVKGYINHTFIDAGTYKLKIKDIEFTDEIDLSKYVYPNIEGLVWEWKINKSQKEITYKWDYENNFEYNGKTKKVQVIFEQEIPKGLEINYVDNEKVDAGKYIAKCYFNQENLENKNYYYNFSGEDLDWEIEKLYCDIEFYWDYDEDKPFEYNGQEHIVSIPNKFPLGIEVEYEENSNKQVNAGEYIAKAKFVYNENNIELYRKSSEIVWKINQKIIDITNLKWDYTGNLEYTGTYLKVEIKDLPNEITAVYEGNSNLDDISKVEQDYIAKVTFIYDEVNYKVIYDESILTLNWRIEKRTNEIIMNTNTKSFYVYDGKKHCVYAQSLHSTDGKSLNYKYYYKETKSDKEKEIPKDLCYRVGYYTVVITDEESKYYKSAYKYYDYAIYKSSLKNSNISIYSTDGFTIESYMNKRNLSSDIQEAISKKFIFAKILEKFTLEIVNDEQRKESKVGIKILLSVEDISAFMKAYSYENGEYKLLPISYNVKESSCYIYCEANENIIIIDGTQVVIFSIWFIIAMIMVNLVIFLLIYTIVRDNYRKYKTVSDLQNPKLLVQSIRDTFINQKEYRKNLIKRKKERKNQKDTIRKNTDIVDIQDDEIESEETKNFSINEIKNNEPKEDN